MNGRSRILLAVLAGALACEYSSRQQPFRLRIALVGPLHGVAPDSEPSASEYARAWVYEPLLRAASDGSPIPALAARFHFSGPSRVIVELREGAKFSDGSPVTAGEVRESLRAARLEVRELPQGLLIESPSGAAIEPFLQQMHVYNEVVLLGFPSSRDPMAHTLAGEADLLIVADPKQLEFFQGVSRLRLVRSHGIASMAVAMSLRRLDRAARIAIADALPVQEIGTLVFGEECLPPFPAGGSHDAALPTRALEVVVMRHDLQVERTALAVSRALGQSSRGVRFVSVPEVFRIVKSQDFDLLIYRPLVWPASSAALLWASDSPGNDLGYRNPKVDAALRAGDWARAMQEVRADPPVVFICVPERIALVDSRVKNPRIDTYGYLETLPDWEVEQ